MYVHRFKPMWEMSLEKEEEEACTCNLSAGASK